MMKGRERGISHGPKVRHLQGHTPSSFICGRAALHQTFGRQMKRDRERQMLARQIYVSSIAIGKEEIHIMQKDTG
jgi:hypothetical protein